SASRSRYGRRFAAAREGALRRPITRAQARSANSDAYREVPSKPVRAAVAVPAVVVTTKSIACDPSAASIVEAGLGAQLALAGMPLHDASRAPANPACESTVTR